MRFVRFPDGTEVRAASLSERVDQDKWRQFGLYLDERWNPSWPSVVIRWKDYELPESHTEAFDQIVSAFTRAKAGEHVEIGCHGGTGRTGTVLACMAILAGVVPKDAVNWVRQHYHQESIDTREQEKWVLWFAEEAERRGSGRGKRMC